MIRPLLLHIILWRPLTVIHFSELVRPIFHLILLIEFLRHCHIIVVIGFRLIFEVYNIILPFEDRNILVPLHRDLVIFFTADKGRLLIRPNVMSLRVQSQCIKIKVHRIFIVPLSAVGHCLICPGSYIIRLIVLRLEVGFLCNIVLS